MEKQLAWELAWIDQHVHMYDSPMHAEAVKRNIEAFLNRLDEAGYTLTDRCGRKVSKGKHQKLGDALRS